MPTKPITSGASETTKITVHGHNVYFKDTLVPSVDPRTGLAQFISFLRELKKPILVAQNCDNFDSKVLVNNLTEHNMLEEFEEIVEGFSDTLPLFKKLLPKESHSQQDLAKKYLKKDYEAHNAIADCRCLQELLKKLCKKNERNQVLQHSFSVNYVAANIKRTKNRTLHLASYAGAIQGKHVTKASAGRLAASGLNFKHIRLGYDRQGIKGVQLLFKKRVGKPQAIAEKLCTFFSL